MTVDSGLWTVALGQAPARYATYMNHPSVRPYFLTAVIVFVLVVTYWIFKPFLIALSMAAIAAVLLRPVFRRILRVIPEWHGTAATLALIIGVIVILVPLTFISLELFSQTKNVYSSVSGPGALTHLQRLADSTAQFLDTKVPGSGDRVRALPEDIRAYSSQVFGIVLSHAAGAFTQALDLFLKFFIFFLALFFFLKEGARTHAAILRLSPLTNEETTTILSRLAITVNSVVKGSLFVGVVQGILACIGFTIFGLPNSLLWGTMTGFAAFVPGIGTSLVLIPSIAYLFIVGHTLPAIGLLLWSMFAIGLVDNFLNPKIIGNRMSIHPLIILLSVLGGLVFYGPSGVFLGPLTVSLLVSLLSIYAPTNTKGEV
ncbi:AI-2E family transporter [soil metagenome]